MGIQLARDRLFIQIPLAHRSDSALLELMLDHRLRSHRFVQQPLQIGTPSGQPQWHISTQGDVLARLLANGTFDIPNHKPNSKFPVSISGDFQVADVPAGRRAHSVPAGGHDENAVLLLSGQVSIDLRSNDSVIRRLCKWLRCLWPTLDSGDLVRMTITPKGLYLTGRLPNAFFPCLDSRRDNASAGDVVTLRLPQPEDSDFKRWLEIKRKFVLKDANDTTIPFWVMANDQPDDYGLLPDDYPVGLSDWLGQLGRRLLNFGLKPQESESRTFIDQVDPGRSTTTRQFLFPTKWERHGFPQTHRHPLRIGWIAAEINVRIAIGGNEAGEANFFPQFICGEIVRTNDEWDRTLLSLEGEAIPGLFDGVSRPDDESQFELRRVDDEVETTIHLAEISVRPIAGSLSEIAEGSGRRSVAWLATRYGWLRVSADHVPVEVTEGRFFSPVLREAINVGAIARLLRGPNSGSALPESGIEVLLQARPASSVRLVMAPVDTAPFTQQLSFRITKPIVTASTPAVWFRNSPGSVADPPDLAIGISDDSFNESDLFDPMRFLSNDTLSVDGTISNHGFVAKLAFYGITGEQQLVMRFPPDRFALQYWHQPGLFPVTSLTAYRQIPENILRIDASRGLIPYVRGTDTPVEVRFESVGLPWLVRHDGSRVVPDHPTFLRTMTDNWKFDLQRTLPVYVPTICGTEVVMQPDITGEAHWMIVHAPSEMIDRLVSATEGDNGRTSADQLELAHVEGGVVIQLSDDPATMKAEGWLLPGRSNPAGHLAVRLNDWQSEIENSPGEPAISLTLEGSGAAHVVQSSRTARADGGVDLPIKAVWSIDADGLPDVDISMSDEDQATHFVRRNGQPIASALLEANSSTFVVTTDGGGRLSAEPENGSELTGRYKESGTEIRSRWSRSVDIAPSVWLEMISIDDGSYEAESGLWTLHDGNGSWPRLFGGDGQVGFLPFARELKVSHQFSEEKIDIELVGILCPEPPPDQSIEHVPGSRGALTIAAKCSAGLASITAISGTIDWSFPEPDQVDGIWLVRVTAKIVKGSVDPARLDLFAVQLTLRHPVGLFRIPLVDGWSVKLTNGKLVFNPPPPPDPEPTPVQLSKMEQFVFQLGTDVIELPASQMRGQPKQLRGAVLSWSRPIADGVWFVLDSVQLETDELQWLMRLERRDDDKNLILIGKIPLRAERNSTNSLLLLSETQDIDAGKINDAREFAKDSWFRPSPKHAPVVLVGVAFGSEEERGPVNLETVSIEAALPVCGREADSWMQEQTRLTAQVTASVGGDGQGGEIRVELSGSFGVANRIRFSTNQSGGNVAFEHRMVVYGDRMNVSIGSFLTGRRTVDEAPEAFAAKVEHFVSIPDGPTIRWQAEQRMQWLRLQEYAESFITDATIPDTDADRLVLNAGAAFVMSNIHVQSRTDPQGQRADLVGPGVRLALIGVDPVLDLSNAAMPAGDFHVMRIPACCGPQDAGGIASPATIHVLTNLADALPVPQLGLQWPTDFDMKFDRNEQRNYGVQVEHVSRSTLAFWLSSDSLISLTRVEPHGETTPLAFINGDQVVKTLPRSLPDYAPWFAADAHYEFVHAWTLLTPFKAGEAFTSVTRPRILVTSHRVEQISGQNNPSPIECQLIVFECGRLKRCAAEQVEVASASVVETLKDWARNELRDRRRNQAAIVLTPSLIENGTPLPGILVPRFWNNGIGRRRANPDWSIAADDGNMGSADPRRLLPLRTGALSPISRVADVALGCLLFSARPAGPINGKATAATWFRLAHLMGSSAERGRLRQAQVEVFSAAKANYETKILALQRFDSVPFVAQSRKQAPFPSTSAEAIAHRDDTIDPVTLATPPGGLTDEDTETVFPPLIEVTSATFRPGESLYSQFRLSRQRTSADSGPIIQSIGRAAAANLRRPRARAADDESVRIGTVTGFNKFHLRGGVFQTKLRIDQVIRRTPQPEPGDCFGVLTTRRNLFGSMRDFEGADQSPVALEQHGSPEKVSEKVEFHLVADRFFRSRASSETGRLLRTTVLFWFLVNQSAPGVQRLPATFGALRTSTAHGIIIWSIPGFEDPEAAWQRHGPPDNFSYVWSLLDVDRSKPQSDDFTMQDEVEKGLEKAIDAGSSLYLIAAEYRDPDPSADLPNDADPSRPRDDWSPLSEDLSRFAIQLKFIDAEKTAKSPALSFSLLSMAQAYNEAGVRDIDCVCSGHTALTDDAFTPVRPQSSSEVSAGTEFDPTLPWSRHVELAHIEPVRTTVADIFDANTKPPTRFDLVARGPDGELIPTHDEQ